MIPKNGPLRRWATDAGGEPSDHEVDNISSGPGGQFPRCPLHGNRIVDRLPARCPLRTDRPGAVIDRLRALAHDELRRGAAKGDAGEALHAFRMAEICELCIARKIGHPAIRRIRRGLGDAA